MSWSRHRSWLARLALTVTVTAAIGVVTAAPAHAYALEGCKYNSSGTLHWQDATTTTVYSTAAFAAIGAWNGSPTALHFIQVTSKANLRIADYDWGNTNFYGVTLDASGTDPVADNPLNECTNGNQGYWTQTNTTYFNRTRTNGLTSAQKTYVMVHEIGHALGLGHTYYSDCRSIMHDGYNWSHCPYSSPQSDDIAGVNHLYPLP